MESFGIENGGDPLKTTAGFLRALDFVETRGARVLVLPSGVINFGPDPSKQIAQAEGTAISLLPQHSRIQIVGFSGSTIIRPVSNRVELFAQRGAEDLSISDISFDNSLEGRLQGTARPRSFAPSGGVAGLGNGANCAIRVYSGGGLRLSRVSFKSFNTCLHYIGDFERRDELRGDLYVDEAAFDDVCFGALVEQPSRYRHTRSRSSNIKPSVHNDGSNDPGHQIYVTNRAGAAPKQIIIDDLMDDHGHQSAIKIRKGELVNISNVNITDSGRGVELWDCPAGAISNLNVRLRSDIVENDSAVELTDCGCLECNNVVIDLRDAVAWGLRLRTDQKNKSWQNTDVRVSGLTIRYNNRKSKSFAPVVCLGQTDVSLDNVRLLQEGDIAGERFPIDIRNCTRAHVRFPQHVAPGGPADAHRLVSVDEKSQDCSVIYALAELRGQDSSDPIRSLSSSTKITVLRPNT